MVARAQFPVGSSVYYASQETADDASAEVASYRRSSRGATVVTAAAVPTPTARVRKSATDHRVAASSRTKAVLKKTAKKYDDLPKLVGPERSAGSREDDQARRAQVRKSPEKKPVVVAHNTPRPARETARGNGKEASRRQGRDQGELLTASILPGSGVIKKTKSGGGGGAIKKTSEASKSRKKKKEE